MNPDLITPNATSATPQDTPVLANLTTRPQEDDSSKDKTTQMEGEEVPATPTYAETVATAAPAPRQVQDRIPPDKQTPPDGTEPPSPFRKGKQLKQSLQQEEQTRTYSTPNTPATSIRKSPRIAQGSARPKDGAGKSP